MSTQQTVLVTGATGLVGRDVLTRLLSERDDLRALVLVRDRQRWNAVRASLGALASRVTAIQGNICIPGLALADTDRARVVRTVTRIVHSAADVVFTRSLADARGTNTEGTSRVLALAAECQLLEQLVYVSTAHVAGRRGGLLLERDNGAEAGWVNNYEQSKYEAEALVRASALPWAIARSAVIICDRPGGPVNQLNASHHTIRLWHRGLVPMMPGSDATVVDLVSLEMVSKAIVRLLWHPDARASTVHLCAGTSAMRLQDALTLAWNVWSADPEWRRRRIPMPALVNLETYRLFEETIADTADPLLQKIVKSLGSFAPTLAYPKLFDTSCADRLTGRTPDSAADLWRTAFDLMAQSGSASRAAA